MHAIPRFPLRAGFDPVLWLTTLAAILAAGIASAQPTYSIDFQGPTAGLVSEGDILTPTAALSPPPPLVVVPSGALGLSSVHAHREVDALSYGVDNLIVDALPPLTFYQWQFSVDEFAVGLPGVPGPSVTTEGALGSMQASADIYGALTPPGPLPPGPGANLGLWDGDGVAFAAPWLNLKEPNPPSPGVVPDAGDNLDAWDFDTPVAPPGDPPGLLTPPVYFSMDSVFPDPLEAPGANTGTAVANGFVGGDVVVTAPIGGPPALYADSRALGLNGGVLTGDPNSIDQDDLDALILWDNGNGVYDPVTSPYSWAGGTTDMLLFSVRRGSAVIGTLDALGSGLLIEEGDILVPVATGPSTWGVGIFVPGDVLGLATARSGVTLYSPDEGNTFFPDDLDALDVTEIVIPEPATAVLLSLGTLALLRRRPPEVCPPEV